MSDTLLGVDTELVLWYAVGIALVTTCLYVWVSEYRQRRRAKLIAFRFKGWKDGFDGTYAHIPKGKEFLAESYLQGYDEGEQARRELKAQVDKWKDGTDEW